GGEDHGLLATFPVGTDLPPGFTVIGRTRAGDPGQVRVDGVPTEPGGWDSARGGPVDRRSGRRAGHYAGHMAVYALGDQDPDMAADAWVHPDAVVIGSVTLGPGVSVWPTAVLRGDYGRIEVGAMSNIQDGSIIHCTDTEPTIFGERCIVGHNVHVEGATIGDGALPSSGSIVLNGSVIGAGAVVAAGCLVPPRF